MKSILFLLITLISCNSKEYRTEKSNSMDRLEYGSIDKITCYLLTLDGEIEVYRIEDDKLYSGGKSSTLDSQLLGKIQDIPEELKHNNLKFGCGICVDAVDFKFVFELKNKKTVLEIQPRSNDVPKEIGRYADLLLVLYNRQVVKPR